jgi:hypothetical protein
MRILISIINIPATMEDIHHPVYFSGWVLRTPQIIFKTEEAKIPTIVAGATKS